MEFGRLTKALLLSAPLAVLSAGSAIAQFSYDYQTGNSYSTTPTFGGGAHVQGFNGRTGSTWSTDIDPNGDMRGMDSRGNTWNYNRSTGSYMNSNGHGCIGQGYGRSCW